MFGALPVPTLISAASRVRVEGLVSDALQKGADKLFTPSSSKETSDTQMLPVILENVSQGADLYYKESFGPVATFFTVDTDDEAIELANNTEYGLTSAVYTKSLTRGLKIAGQIQSG